MTWQADESLVRLSSKVRYRDVGGEGVIVHLDSGRVIVVNTIGLFVLQQLGTAIDHLSLVEAIVREFDVCMTEAEADLVHYLDELDKEKLLERVA